MRNAEPFVRSGGAWARHPENVVGSKRLGKRKNLPGSASSACAPHFANTSIHHRRRAHLGRSISARGGQASVGNWPLAAMPIAAYRRIIGQSHRHQHHLDIDLVHPTTGQVDPTNGGAHSTHTRWISKPGHRTTRPPDVAWRAFRKTLLRSIEAILQESLSFSLCRYIL